MQEQILHAVAEQTPYWLHKLDEVITHGIIISSSVYLAAKWLDKRADERHNQAVRDAARKAILEEQTDFGRAVISRTFFHKTGDAYNMVIDPDGRASIENMLGPELWLTIQEYWKKAEEDCTSEKPSPLQHLHKHVPQNHWPAIQEVLLREWRNWFDLNSKEKLHGVLPIPIMEPGPHDRMKPAILLIQLDKNTFPELPLRENVRFRDHDADAFEIMYEDNQGNYEGDRYDALHALFNDLSAPDTDTAWIRRIVIWDLSKTAPAQNEAAPG